MADNEVNAVPAMNATTSSGPLTPPLGPSWSPQAPGGNFHLCMTLQPWPRTGSGTAKDGKPKFDLSTFAV